MIGGNWSGGREKWGKLTLYIFFLLHYLEPEIGGSNQCSNVY
jgi:hypothetical protein